MNKEFEKWAAGYFSWSDKPNEHGQLDAAEQAWDTCKTRILAILKQPIQNADLSIEEIDSRFIAKIEESI